VSIMLAFFAATAMVLSWVIERQTREHPSWTSCCFRQ
jgi:hypothetical protein